MKKGKEKETAPNSWNSDLLASRLYSDNSQKAFDLSAVNTKNTGNVRGLHTSQSVPTLKVKQQLIPDKNKNITLKTLASKNDRSLILKSSAVDEDNSKMSYAIETIKPIEAHDQKKDENYNERMSFLDSLHLSPAKLHELFNVPKTFFYLEPKSDSTIRAYDLRVISQDRINKDHYFTLSKAGITQHSTTESQFTSFSQWEREYHLFHKISIIPFFKQYRRWKVYTFSHIYIYKCTYMDILYIDECIDLSVCMCISYVCINVAFLLVTLGTSYLTQSLIEYLSHTLFLC